MPLTDTQILEVEKSAEAVATSQVKQMTGRGTSRTTNAP